MIFASLFALTKVDRDVITPGNGESPTPGATVRVHYTGTLMDGTKFDSSRDRGEEFKFALGRGQVIPCWDQGVAAMTFGERSKLTCSSDTAYGSRGAGALSRSSAKELPAQPHTAPLPPQVASSRRTPTCSLMWSCSAERPSRGAPADVRVCTDVQY